MTSKVSLITQKVIALDIQRDKRKHLYLSDIAKKFSVYGNEHVKVNTLPSHSTIKVEDIHITYIPHSTVVLVLVSC